ncbi:MAG: DUF3153 domain-containing protein [Leptolyngbya sp. SIO4C1]|nr:DUF3153 domain-containing protein [Leptolyngbya sp. SIO4C1]
MPFRIRAVAIALLALCLTGCVDYDVGIRFDSQTHGVITQTLHLDQRLLAFNQASAERWLTQFEADARALSARVKRPEPETIQVRLPFYSGEDLVKKFNMLFGAGETSLLRDLPGAPQLASNLSLEQQNWLLALHNHLTYDLDLRQLQTQPAARQGVISNLQVLTLSFQLQTPWGLQQAANSSGLWQLQPGQLNHIEADFWIPSPIGIGAAAIALLVGLGYFVKYGVG